MPRSSSVRTRTTAHAHTHTHTHVRTTHDAHGTRHTAHAHDTHDTRARHARHSLDLGVGVVVVFVYGFKDGGFLDSPLNMPVIRIETYPQFFGTAAFLFSITMYLFPIESSMREPKRFNASLHIAFFITTIGMHSPPLSPFRLRGLSPATFNA